MKTTYALATEIEFHMELGLPNYKVEELAAKLGPDPEKEAKRLLALGRKEVLKVVWGEA